MRPGGQPNMQQLMKQAQKMQQQLAAAQEELADAEVTGTAGGGLVTATVTGTGELRRVTIDPTAVDPDDVETLQDLVVAAVRDANRAAGELAAAEDGPARRRAGRRSAAWACPASEAGTMMYEGAVQDLIDELGRLPGVGPKSAQRIAFHLLAADPADVEPAGRRAAAGCKDEVRFCAICGNVAEAEQCRICRDPRRDDDGHLRRRGAQGRRRDRADPRVPRPLPRARRRDQPDRRRRPGRPADPRAADAAARRRRSPS